MYGKALAIAALAVALSAPTLGQQAPSVAATLDVASVRKNDSGTFQQSINIQPGGTLVVVNFPVGQLIPIAYGMQPSQVTGGPDWLRSERYDITAKSVEGVSNRDVLRTLLRTVLAERFKLTAQTEMRELPVYALVTSAQPWQPGSRIKRVTSGCGVTTTGSAPPEAPRCNLTMPPGRIVGVGADISMLASALGSRFGRPVIDKTGITGWFDVDLEFTPETLDSGVGVSASLVTALQEQLGLKVQPERAMRDVLVIDSIQRPTDN
jgi:bla regulator protein blaR1